MLYISRYIYKDKFGLVDTDFCTETLVDCDQIEFFLKQGPVMGVAVEEDEKKLFRFLRIQPYQPPETMSALQVKTSLMKRVDVLTYENRVTSVTWYCNEITEPVEIRLSDFGEHIGDCVFLGNSDSSHEKKVICVFDDKLKSVSDRALNTLAVNAPALCYIGVVFDLRELTKTSLVETIYEQASIMSFYGDEEPMILDDPVRYRQFRKRIEGA